MFRVKSEKKRYINTVELKINNIEYLVSIYEIQKKRNFILDYV
jgi:hypothetical protein